MCLLGVISRFSHGLSEILAPLQLLHEFIISRETGTIVVVSCLTVESKSHPLIEIVELSPRSGGTAIFPGVKLDIQEKRKNLFLGLKFSTLTIFLS